MFPPGPTRANRELRPTLFLRFSLDHATAFVLLSESITAHDIGGSKQGHVTEYSLR